MSIFKRFFDRGEIVIAYGEHHIEVHTHKPKKVFIRMESKGEQVCGTSDIDKVGYLLKDNSIVFDCEVYSDELKITWYSL